LSTIQANGHAADKTYGERIAAELARRAAARAARRPKQPRQPRALRQPRAVLLPKPPRQPPAPRLTAELQPGLVTLGIDFSTFDSETAITLAQASKYIRGRQGRISLDVLRRWCTKGCRPVGPVGPCLIFPTFRIGGIRLTQVAWCQLFEQMRVRLSMAAQAAVPR
jgi:hypothetical protein